MAKSNNITNPKTRIAYTPLHNITTLSWIHAKQSSHPSYTHPLKCKQAHTDQNSVTEPTQHTTTLLPITSERYQQLKKQKILFYHTDTQPGDFLSYTLTIPPMPPIPFHTHTFYTLLSYTHRSRVPIPTSWRHTHQPPESSGRINIERPSPKTQPS